jgi:hypothetical protein
MEDHERTKRLGNFDSVMVERVEMVRGSINSEYIILCGYRITPFNGSKLDNGPVLIRPTEVASVIAVIQADQEEERRELVLRTELRAVKDRHKGHC